MRTLASYRRAVLLVPIAALATLAGCDGGDTNDADNVETAFGQGESAPTPALGIAVAADDPRSSTLGRLAQLYEGAPVSEFMTADERLAKARAWVDANRPDTSDRLREVEAQFLAIMAGFFAMGESITLNQFRGLMSLELLDAWALDADRDGEVTDEELEAAKFLEQIDPTEHPFLREQYDTDGDGELSDAEREAARTKMEAAGQEMVGSLGQDIARRIADTDGDGTVSNDERKASLRAMMSTGPWAAAADTDGDGNLSDEEWAVAAPQYQNEDGIADEVFFTAAATAFMTRVQVTAEATMAAMKETFGDPPAPPDFASFNADGEGPLSEEERNAWQEAQAAYAETSRDWYQDYARKLRLARFYATESMVDTNLDGIATDDEWAAAHVSFDHQRDANLFRWFYDTDQSGSVGPAEADAFVRLFEQSHPRADINLDGTLDQNDVRLFAQLFVEQE